MKGFILALQFLTRLPAPRINATEAEFAGSMRWFPAVGMVIGGVIAVTAWLVAHLDSWIAALATLLVWVGITGALHLDGLADLADAGGAVHKDRDKLLAVLADPHIGSFGVVAIGLQLLAKLVLLHAVIDAGLMVALIAVPFAARIAPLAWTCWLPPLHAGLAARFQSAIRPMDLAFWAAALLASAWAVPALLITPVVMLWWGLRIQRTLGGISGDGHGAGIELIETVLLLAIVIAARLI